MVSPNLDTIYSVAIVNARQGFSLTADVGDQFLSAQIVTEDHLTPFYLYGGNPHDFSARISTPSSSAWASASDGRCTQLRTVRKIVEELQPQYAIEGAAPENDVTPVDMPLLQEVLNRAHARLFGTAQYLRCHAEEGSRAAGTEVFTFHRRRLGPVRGRERDVRDRLALPMPRVVNATSPPSRRIPAKAFFSITAYGPRNI